MFSKSFTVVFAATVALSHAAYTLEADLSDLEFNEFAKANRRNYGDIDEYKRRQHIYNSNQKMVEWLNSRNDDDAEYRLNHLADMEPKEFLMSLNEEEPFFDRKDYLPVLPTHGLPSSFDWREQGAVSDVRNQGQIGSCWAFSAAANIEGQQFLKTKEMVPLSVEQLVECDNTDCGAFGGWPHYAYQFVQKNGGLMKWSELPYCAGDGSCQPCMPSNYNITTCGDHSDMPCQHNRHICSKLKSHEAHARVKGWGVVHRDEEQIKAALIKYGPLSIALDATLLQFYYSGIWNPFFCSKTLNHALLLVGYGEELGKPYWIVKNSWSEDWGMDGYFKMVRGKAKCGITVSVTTAFVE